MSRRWVDTVVSVEETATQVRVLYEHHELEGLLELLTDERFDLSLRDPPEPILLAVSDNAPPVTSCDTRAFFGHCKGEWPRLQTITEPSVLVAEFARVRT